MSLSKADALNDLTTTFLTLTDDLDFQSQTGQGRGHVKVTCVPNMKVKGQCIQKLERKTDRQTDGSDCSA